jgi:transglutaminase-like putative cysteine protease
MYRRRPFPDSRPTERHGGLEYGRLEIAMREYLQATSVIDWEHPEVAALARALAEADAVTTAKRCFEWVRDEVQHSGDYQLNPVTCAASEVLRHCTGYCYAKSHLLAALLRANGIPAGLCYQRLSLDDRGTAFCLHGLNAVFLPEFGWYRIDARGNKPSVNAQFVPPSACLAFKAELPGEADLPDVYADPLPHVVEALRQHKTFEELAKYLPDAAPA